MKRIILQLFMLVLLTAQDSIRVSHILVTGNENTDTDIITRELPFDEFYPVSVADIDYAISRLRGLNIFNNVEYDYFPTDSGTVLQVRTTKKLNLIILPRFELYENDTKKASYGAGISHNNLFKRNVIVSAYFQMGYQDGAQLSFQNPWFAGDNRLFYKFDASSTFKKNEHYDFVENDVSELSFVFGKGFNNETRLGIGLEYIKFEFGDDAEYSVSKTKEDRILIFKSQFNYNSLGYWKYPRFGYQLDVNFRYGSEFKSDRDVNFCQISEQFSHYMSLNSEWIYAFNINNSNAYGDLPYYFEQQLGSGNLIRGNSDLTESFGRHRFIYRHEFRFDIIRSTSITLDLPLARSFVENMNTSVFAYAWQDVGQLYVTAQDLIMLDNYHFGHGLGIAAIFPYVKRLALEVGVSPSGNVAGSFTIQSFF
jgi:outer membrane protein assembly factor BamA